MLTKKRKYLKRTLIALPLLLILFVLALQIASFQTFLAQRLANNIANKLHTNVRISKISFSWFDGLLLSNLYVEDQLGDTLLYVDDLSIGTDSLFIKDKRFYFSKLKLNHTYYNLYEIDSNGTNNMQFLIDYFSSDKKTDTTKSHFKFSVKEIDISHLRFKYKNTDTSEIENKINFNKINLDSLSLSAQNFIMIDDSIHFVLNHLNLKEQSGFQIDDFKGAISLSPSATVINKLILRTSHSHLTAEYYKMAYSEWSAMSDFINKVKLSTKLNLSTLNILDLSYFSSIAPIDLPVFVSGEIKGKIKRLRGKRLAMSLGENTNLLTRFSIDGLPDIDKSFLMLDIQKMNVDVDDIASLHWKDSLYIEDALPAFVKKINNIRYTGNITGFLTDLVAYGTYSNANGILQTDMNFKYNLDNRFYQFSGTVKTEKLDLSNFSSDSLLGKVSLEAKLVASIDSTENIKGVFDGKISAIDINNYKYQNIQLQSAFDKKKIDGIFSVKDSNLIVNANGYFDFAPKEPITHWDLKIDKAQLFALKWYKKDSCSTIALHSQLDFVSFDAEKTTGTFSFDSVLYSEKKDSIFLQRFVLNSKKQDNQRLINIASDLVDAEVKGQFTSIDLMQHIEKLAYEYSPALLDKPKKQKLKKDENISINVHLKKISNVFSVFAPHIFISDNSHIKGFYTSNNDSLNLSLDIDSCDFDYFLAENIHLNVNGNTKNIKSSLWADNLLLNNDINLENIVLSNYLHKDTSSFYLQWTNTSGDDIAAEISALGILKSVNDSLNFNLFFDPSYFFLDQEIWYINDADLAFSAKEFSISKMTINNEQQYIYAEGKVSDNPKDSLNLIINNINLADFSYLQKKAGVNIKGEVQGNIIYKKVHQTPWINGDLKINKFKINERLLGDTKVQTFWNQKNENLEVSLSNRIGRKNLETIKADGFLDFKHQILQIDGNINRQLLSFFQPFVEDNISDLRGKVSGKFNLSGSFSNPQYEVALHLQKAKMTIDYLGTRYNFSDSIYINPKEIRIPKLQLFQIDGLGDYALVKGNIKHNNFSDIQFNINIDAHNFMVLNTNELQNSMYYGTAFLSGITKIHGDIQNIQIDITGSTQKGTHFFIPISDEEDVEGSNFISFIDHSKFHKKEDKYKLDLSGILLNFDLDVTPDAEVQIIFDNKVGDIVKARGEGAFDISINTLGNFSIAGEYIITEGDYLFTLQNVINKKFKIEKGSSIKWNGDPYQAYLNINAIYRLKTPLYDLTLDQEDKKRIPVECLLSMNKSLLSPDIKFDIKLPSSNDKAKGLINGMNQDEKNKQLLSLMIMNKFYTPDYLRGGEQSLSSGNAAGKNASELLSNQLSNWLSQISNDFDIGVNYRPGDEISSNELEVALSTQLFNDRVSIDGNVGVGNYQNNTNNVIGNVNIDVKINKKGNLRVRGFNRANDNNLENNSLYTQGIGLYYREDFNSWAELLRKYWKKSAKTVAKKDSTKNK